MIHTGKQRSRIYLFARPSFLTGVARIADPLGTLNRYNTSQDEKLADSRALRSDWLAVGDDLRFAIRQYKKQVGTNDRR